jgi:hypothetical protein
MEGGYLDWTLAARSLPHHVSCTTIRSRYLVRHSKHLIQNAETWHDDKEISGPNQVRARMGRMRLAIASWSG